MVSLKEIKQDPVINAFIKKGNEHLGAMGFTDHGYLHVLLVSMLSREILLKLGYEKRTAELAGIAGYMHDIGNVINRQGHSQSGAIIAMSILKRIGLSMDENAIICAAIGNHDEGSGHPVSEVAAALILADKSHLHRNRVLNTGLYKFDIHDRVNYAVEYSIMDIDPEQRLITMEQSYALLEEALYEFPVQEVNIKLPGWVEELDEEFWLREDLETAIHEILTGVRKVRDIETALQKLSEVENISYVLMEEMNLGTGTAAIDITVPEELFYRSLSEVSGFDVAGTQDIMRIMKDLSFAKKEFDKVSSALAEVKESGYGVVTPRLEEMFLEEPELIRQGSRFGVRLKAKAPSLHIIRADITTEITPIIGTEKQCEELVRYMLDEFEEDPTKIWESNIFGKSLHDLVREGIQNKLHRMPENAQLKLQDTLQRSVNDGSGGLICIII
jgi:hypothetical protein